MFAKVWVQVKIDSLIFNTIFRSNNGSTKFNKEVSNIFVQFVRDCKNMTFLWIDGQFVKFCTIYLNKKLESLNHFVGPTNLNSLT